LLSNGSQEDKNRNKECHKRQHVLKEGYSVPLDAQGRLHTSYAYGCGYWFLSIMASFTGSSFLREQPRTPLHTNREFAELACTEWLPCTWENDWKPYPNHVICWYLVLSHSSKESFISLSREYSPQWVNHSLQRMPSIPFLFHKGSVIVTL